MKSTDPGRMSAPAIMAEIGELLVAGFQRCRAEESKHAGAEQISQDRLDVVGGVEAQCQPCVENHE